MSNIESTVKKLAEMFKALGNPHRLFLFQRLSRCCQPGTRCELDEAISLSVGQLGEGMNIAPSTLSHHLKALHYAGLIEMERQGKRVNCWIDPLVLNQLSDFFNPQSEIEESMMSEETNNNSPEVSLSDLNDSHRQEVRQAYAKVALSDNVNGCCGVESGCCGVSDDVSINTLISTRLGYSPDDLDNVPSGANMGLGCGNPKAIAALQAGEVVVDLGSGGGFDCFLAAAEVGDAGQVIGVDMTPDMLSKARNNAIRGKYKNVEFRLGEIEALPIADDSADVIISNCVINLSPDKGKVFQEAFRVLKPGGRLAISDVVATAELPQAIRSDPQLVSGCMGNASMIEELERFMNRAGFTHIKIEPKDESREFIRDWAPGRGVEDYVVSATIEAIKPSA